MTRTHGLTHISLAVVDPERCPGCHDTCDAIGR